MRHFVSTSDRKSEFGTVLAEGFGGSIIRLDEKTSTQEIGTVVFISSAFNPLNADEVLTIAAELDKYNQQEVVGAAA